MSFDFQEQPEPAETEPIMAESGERPRTPPTQAEAVGGPNPLTADGFTFILASQRH